MSKMIGFASISFIALAAATAASAQTAPPAGANATPAPTTSNGDIVVTGSRVRTTFNSPVPVNVVSEVRMQQLAIPDVATALNQLPSFRATTTPASDIFRIGGTIGGNQIDLRGLGSTRTLVLMDGRRIVPSADNGTVDLNGIPSAMVQRSEVVTGGASAQYGADAVAGVVNLILDTKFTGFKTDANAGASEHGDDVNYFFSATYGHDFAGGRGHIIAGAEYQANRGVYNCYQRSYCSKLTNYVGNPGYINGVSTNGLPATLVLNNVNFVYNPTGILLSATQTVAGKTTTLNQQVNASGTFTGPTQLPAALQGLSFNNGGTALVPFQFGNYLSGNFMQGGDASTDNNWGFGDDALDTPVSHFSFLTHADYDVTDHMQVFGEFMFNRVSGGPIQAGHLTENLPMTVNNVANPLLDNPYLTPAVRAQILAANPNITSINVASVFPNSPEGIGYSNNDTFRMLVGAKGDLFGFRDWRWDAAYELGQTDSRTTVSAGALATLASQAFTPQTPPPGYTGPIYATPAGAPVICSSSVANPNNGCVPVDLVGNNLTQAQIKTYFSNSPWQTRTFIQNDVSANLHGTLLTLPAGTVQAAAGFEFRQDSTSGGVDNVTQAGLFNGSGVTPLTQVVRQVTELYIEANIPVLANLPFAKSLSVDLTGRETYYNAFGSAQPWKVGLEYQPDEQIMFRLTKSADIRQPTAAESNPNATTTLLPMNDPFQGNQSHGLYSVTGGNPNLGLEYANTNTAGVVLRPNFIPGLHTSLDWYDITVKDAIDSVTAAAIVSACANQNLLCNLIAFSGAYKASPITYVYSNYQNEALFHAEGFEMSADYTFHHLWDGDLTFQGNANYVMDLKEVGGTGLITRMNGVTGNAGSLSAIAGVPTYKIDGVISYSRSIWTLTTHLKYVPRSILDPTKIGPGQAGYNVNSPISVSNNFVDDYFQMDLSGSVRLPKPLIGHSMEIYGAINNLLDAQPPSELRLFGNPLQYDPIGRAFRLGIRSSW